MNDCKILIIVSHFQPPITGGEIYNDKLYKYLANKFHQVEVVSIYDTPFRFKGGFIFRNLWFIKLLYYRKNNMIIIEDIVRSSDLFIFNITNNLLRGAFRKNIKTIPLVHHTYSSLEKNRFNQTLKIIYEYLFMFFADKIIVNSAFTQEEVYKIIKKRNKDVLIAHPGLSIHHYKKNIKDGRNLELLFVGSVTRRKDVKTIIDSLYILISKYNMSNVRLHIVGALDKESDYSLEVRDICKSLNLEENVKFHGRVNDDMLAILYSNSDIFVFSSLWEGFGMVLAEAMHYKLPIVATNVGAIPFLVKDGVNGFLIPPGDSEKMAYSIFRLIKNPKSREMIGKINYEKSLEFNWENTFEQIEKFIVY